jgi:hypothetical protein
MDEGYDAVTRSPCRRSGRHPMKHLSAKKSLGGWCWNHCTCAALTFSPNHNIRPISRRRERDSFEQPSYINLAGGKCKLNFRTNGDFVDGVGPNLIRPRTFEWRSNINISWNPLCGFRQETGHSQNVHLCARLQAVGKSNTGTSWYPCT